MSGYKYGGYENAPATQLLATHCGICNRPLLDSDSVERGIGPTCAEKYGYGDAQGEPDPDKAEAVLRAAGVEFERKADARSWSNSLVYLIALDREAETVPAMIEAIRLLGYWQLADVLHERIVEAQIKITITIDESAGLYLVETPYDPDAVAAMREIPGRRWDKQLKLNKFPTSSRKQLWGFLLAYYPGEIARGPQGTFTIQDNRQKTQEAA